MSKGSDHNDDFYIGYMPKAPTSHGGFAKLVALTILVVTAGVSALVVLNQKQSNTASFEYGTLTEVEGVVYKAPVPLIRISDGNGGHQTLLLINFLKHGAGPLLANYQNRVSAPLEKSLLKMRGTLIYHDGVTLLELTEQENALIEFTNYAEAPDPTVEDLGTVALNGEIVDPKCYFGSMKPGDGKAHRSCAVRCISGGIPPVFAIKNEAGDAQYVLLVGEKGQQINKEVLPYVGDQLKITGRLERFDDWLVMNVNAAQDLEVIARREDTDKGVHPHLAENIHLCESIH